MKRLLIITTLTLSLVIGLALWRVGRGVHAKTAAAPVVAATYPLNPNQFTSLGASPCTSAGTYSIDASKDNPAPTLSGPGIAVPIAGVFYSPSGGAVARDEIAVFTFNSLDVPAGVVIEHAANGNSRPVALLSQSTTTVDGTISVGGNGTTTRNGGNAGPGGGGGGGGAPSGIGGLGFFGGGMGGSNIGGNGGSVVAGGGGTSQPGTNHGGGGAFGGNGGNALFPGVGGTAYGNLALILQGGSGGAGSGVDFEGGGGGGGAVELGATGNLTINGSVLANGGASFSSGGGGAGGGILVHAPAVSLTGSLNAIGGASEFGGIGRGGGGGGGRVLILTADGTLASGSLAANVDINGGNSDLGGDGGTGVKELGIGMFNQAPVAQCQSVTIAAGASCTANASIDNGSFDPDSGDTITVTQSPAGPYALGTTTVMLTVTDSSGASSSCQATVTVVDQTAPVISCPANVVAYLPLNSMDTGVVVNYPAPTVSDNCTASPTLSYSKASGSSFLVGTTTVTATATDAAGNQSTCSFTVTVRYNFSGFFQPVDNLPMVNSVNAGQSIPVKFSLSGNKGLNIFAAGYPQSQQIACSSGAPVDAIEETVTAGGSSLSYDATTDQYKYVWKTEKAWKGTCRKLILKFIDGTTREALFQFK